MSQLELNTDDLLLGVDIGGSHIAAASVSARSFQIVEDSLFKTTVNATGTEDEVFEKWLQVINSAISKSPGNTVLGIGIAIPGPFDYENGISHIQGVSKYDALYGKNIREILSRKLNTSLPIYFQNDAGCFGLGQVHLVKDISLPFFL